MASLLAATHPARCIGRRRLGSSSVATRGFHRTAQDAADELMGAFGGKTVSRRQLIDGNQLQKLALTLGRPRLAAGQGHGHGQGGADDLVVDVSDAAPPTGTPVPPGHHLVYFTPGGLEAQLGMDGTDTAYNAPSPFTRRMWAGGVMRWPGAGRGDTGLRVGDEAEERTRLLSATPKKSRSAGEMILVEVEKEFWTARGLAVVDRRSWVFRPTLDAGAGTGAAPPPPGLAIERDAREPSRVADVDDGHGECTHTHTERRRAGSCMVIRVQQRHKRLTAGRHVPATRAELVVCWAVSLLSPHVQRTQDPPR